MAEREGERGREGEREGGLGALTSYPGMRSFKAFLWMSLKTPFLLAHLRVASATPGIVQSVM